MRFVEEKHKHGLIGITHLRQTLEKFGKEPEEKGGIKLGRANELVGGEDVDDALPLRSGLQEVHEIEGRLTEELRSALFFQPQEAALNGADAGCRDVAVVARQVMGVFRDVLEHRPEVLHVDEGQAVVGGDTKGDAENAALDVVQPEQASQQ